MEDLKDQKPDPLDYTGVSSGVGPGSVLVRSGSFGPNAHPYYIPTTLVIGVPVTATSAVPERTIVKNVTQLIEEDKCLVNIDTKRDKFSKKVFELEKELEDERKNSEKVKYDF